MMRRLAWLIGAAMLMASAAPVAALDAAVVDRLVFGDGDEKSRAIDALVAEGDPRAERLLQALADENVQTAGQRVLIVNGDAAIDAVTGAAVAPLPADRDDVVVNNRLRRELSAALAAFKLTAPSRDVRLSAARQLADSADAAMLPLIKRALGSEQDVAVRSSLESIAATLELHADDRNVRLAAIRRLGQSSSGNAKTLLLGLLERTPAGTYVETDEEVRSAAQSGLRAVDNRLAWGERVGLLFAGVSLGSILLLAALGLAITYGLMGVINMAHGELIMVGAYATYVVQSFFRSHLPQWFDFYLLLGMPAAFVAAALVGMALERAVI